MAPLRARTLKPDIWMDARLGRVSIGARLLFVGLITQADDEGRFNADSAIIRAAIFPRDTFAPQSEGTLPGIAAELDVDRWLDELQAAGRTKHKPGLIRLWTVGDERFGDLPGWVKNQRLRYVVPSKIPPISQRSPLQAFPDRSRPIPSDSESTPAIPGINENLPPREERRGEKKNISTVGAKAPPVSPDRKRSSVTRGQGMKVWEAYAAHHPTSVLTDKRKALIRQQIAAGYEPERLIAAIEGNHLDPHCNGQNDRGKTYHDLELILRDAAHIERYEAVYLASQNGGKTSHAVEKQVAAAIARFRDVAAAGTREDAEDWLDAVHTPEIVDRVLAAVGEEASDARAAVQA